jgi:hypothetical protein
MKSRFKLLLIGFLVVCLNQVNFAQKAEEVCYNPNLIKDTTKKSIKSMAFYILDKDSIKIKYHSPGVRKRIIWGGLVPFDEVWVTGAHDATLLEMPKAFIVNGKKIAAGKYAFFTIPGEKEWILIINKNWQQHLASAYDEKEDIIRFKVKPQSIPHTERLQYTIEMPNQKTGKISVAWEKKKVELPFSISQ